MRGVTFFNFLTLLFLIVMFYLYIYIISMPRKVKTRRRPGIKTSKSRSVKRNVSKHKKVVSRRKGRKMSGRKGRKRTMKGGAGAAFCRGVACAFGWKPKEKKAPAPEPVVKEGPSKKDLKKAAKKDAKAAAKSGDAPPEAGPCSEFNPKSIEEDCGNANDIDLITHEPVKNYRPSDLIKIGKQGDQVRPHCYHLSSLRDWLNYGEKTPDRRFVPRDVINCLGVTKLNRKDIEEDQQQDSSSDIEEQWQQQWQQQLQDFRVWQQQQQELRDQQQQKDLELARRMELMRQAKTQPLHILDKDGNLVFNTVRGAAMKGEWWSDHFRPER